MIDLIVCAGIALGVMLLYVYQDGVLPCNDGKRYTSRRRQPRPFHRRFCGWHPTALKWVSWVSLFGVAVSLGEWWKTLLFITIPGVWFCVTRPETVDGPSMGLAWLSAWLLPTHPVAACFAAVLSGFVHERGPVFAALYAWHPLPLLGLLGVMWWRTPAPRDGDPYVGMKGLWPTMLAQKRMQDFMDWKGWLFPTKAIVPLGVLAHVPLEGWAPLGVATATRIMGTDNSRFVMWGVPAVLAHMASAPAWIVVLHAMLTVRCF